VEERSPADPAAHQLPPAPRLPAAPQLPAADPSTDGTLDVPAGGGVTDAPGGGVTDAPGGRMTDALRRGNRRPGVVNAVRATREILPGDPRFGDELSIAGDRPAQLLARHLGEPRGSGENAIREATLAALQVFHALSDKVAGGPGAADVVAILFTDLVGFSAWVLEVGDELALELLRSVAGVVEPEITKRGGRIVKRLGDGHMAAFASAQAGVEAALQIQAGIDSVEVGGHRPRLRAGLHLGHPHRLGDDYLGTDVNIAARVGAAARAGEVLVSDAVLAELATDGLKFKRRRRFHAKGAPREMEVYAVSRTVAS
jgi:adenylate cyclase